MAPMRRGPRARLGAIAMLMAALCGAMVGGAGPATASLATADAAGSVSGHVTVPPGVDVTQVTVTAHAASLSGQAGWASVAADGSYTITGLPPDRYVVEFNGWAEGLVLQYFPRVLNWDQASPVTVGAGPVTGVDATLVIGATVTGTIHSNSDCELEYVRVGVMRQGISPDATVLPDGRWTVTGLPSGTYWVQFDGGPVGLGRALWNGYGDPRGRSLVTLTEGQTTSGIDITMNGPVSGCITFPVYVQAVYQDLLGRYPDGEGLNGWTNALGWGTPLWDVANGITSSEEYRGRLIRGAYETYLGRPADRSGLAGWLAAMRAGLHIEEIEIGFVASEEFWLRHGATPDGWVTGLYRTVLNREPAATEVRWWVSLMTRGMSRDEVARGFLYSSEHLATVVDGYYVQLLRRHIDAVGRAGWVHLIQSGRRDEEIIAGILASPEYRGLVMAGRD